MRAFGGQVIRRIIPAGCLKARVPGRNTPGMPPVLRKMPFLRNINVQNSEQNHFFPARHHFPLARRKERQPLEHVEGANRGDITLYALSTCVWCKKTRRMSAPSAKLTGTGLNCSCGEKFALPATYPIPPSKARDTVQRHIPG